MCMVLGGTAKLCLTVLAWTRCNRPEDTVKLRLAVPPGYGRSQFLHDPGWGFSVE